MTARAMVGALITAGLVLGAAAASGQSEEPLDQMGANFWTGTWTSTDFEPGVETARDGYTENLGGIAYGEVEADDPRMVGKWAQVNNVHFAESREPDEGDVGILNGTARIDNDAGAWVGTFTAFGGQPGAGEWYVMEGEGAYEGLITIFVFHPSDGSFEGVILPSALPPLPDPAPPAE
jgi:hypothetical protein